MLDRMDGTRWRVAVTRDDEGEGAVRRALENAGFVAVACPVIVEGPPPDPERLHAAARGLERFDWVICASVRAVRALTAARGSRWPKRLRTAAVGKATAAAMREAGASDPVVGEAFNAKALWETLRSLDDWQGKKVLVPTVAGGRQELIEGLRKQGAHVTEVEAYTMTARPHDAIRRDWVHADPEAVILGSPATARRLIHAVGVDALAELKAIIAIGPTTHAALKEAGLSARMPREATFLSAVDELRALVSP
ncbi:MAG TPA: uroporphyrinogen-III synthase [Vicinamibacterales bacterium]|nr:uroporphyrinogen-III synthase [Vicinamibacterales bacterium]